MHIFLILLGCWFVFNLIRMSGPEWTQAERAENARVRRENGGLF